MAIYTGRTRAPTNPNPMTSRLGPFSSSANDPHPDPTRVLTMEFILEQGSSLHPAFQYAVDAAFAALLCVLVAMLAVTRSWHFVFLTFIEIALWASVKWCVLLQYESHRTLTTGLRAGSCTSCAQKKSDKRPRRKRRTNPSLNEWSRSQACAVAALSPRLGSSCCLLGKHKHCERGWACQHPPRTRPCSD